MYCASLSNPPMLAMPQTNDDPLSHIAVKKTKIQRNRVEFEKMSSLEITTSHHSSPPLLFEKNWNKNLSRILYKTKCKS